MTPIPPIQARRSAADRASDDAGTRHRDLDYSGSVFLPWCRTTVGLLATIVAALAVGAPAAFAAPNEIAYRCGADICLLDPDNPSNVTNLTNKRYYTFGSAGNFGDSKVWGDPRIVSGEVSIKF